MKRRAYIGLSSPTAYFYDHDQSHFKEEWKWNPILESPQGLITLFDELWFLSRALCPVSLRKEKYVKFLNEDSDYLPLIKKIGSVYVTDLEDGLKKEYSIIEEIMSPDPFKESMADCYNRVIDSVYGRAPGRGAPIDNHSHGIELIEGVAVSGNSWSTGCLAFDIAFLSNAAISNIELITNSFNTAAFKQKRTAHDLLQVSQGVTISRIPVLQTPVGPVIDRIDGLRESNFLVDFRDKIWKIDEPKNVKDLVTGIENEFKRYRNDVLLKKQSESKLINSISKNALSFVIGGFIPGVGELKSLKDDAATRNWNWTGFLADIED